MRVFLPGWGSLPEIWTPFAGPDDRVGGEPQAGDDVVGWSLGAMQALEAALTVPVRSLTLISATGRFTRDEGYRHGWRPSVLEGMRARLTADPPGLLHDFFGLGFSPDPLPDDFPYDFDLERLDHGLRYLERFDLLERLAEVRVPVRLLHGDRDRVCPLAAAEQLAAALPDAELTVWPDVGHVPFLVAPDRFRAWLGG